MGIQKKKKTCSIYCVKIEQVNEGHTQKKKNRTKSKEYA